MLPVRPRITVHPGVLVLRLKLEAMTEVCVKVARLVQLIIGLAR